MKLITTLVLLASSLQCFASSITSREAAVFEKIPSSPSGWAHSGAPNPGQKLNLHVTLAHPHNEHHEKLYLDISTPGSNNYGKHLSHTTLSNLITPPDAYLDAVLSWLNSESIQDVHVHSNAETVSFCATVSQAERLLATEFLDYQDTSNRTVTRALSYSIPAYLHDKIDLIHPVTRFQPIQALRTQALTQRSNHHKRTTQPVNCTVFNSPSCLRELYNIHSYTPSPKTHNRIGVAGFFGNHAIYADLAQFETEYAPWATGANFSVTSINNGTNTQDGAGSGEANLDIQYVVTLTHPTNVTFYTDGALGPQIPDAANGPSPNEDWLGFAQFLLSLPDAELPAVISMSYGEDEQNVPLRYARHTCRLFARLAARGVSVVIGSGDFGPGTQCLANGADPGLPANTTAFVPEWPSGCPWITSVGGTDGKNPERAWSGSSGGFSNRFARPRWQDPDVRTYLRGIGDTFAGLYNRSGRAYPDVAAQATSYLVIDDGNEDADDGTSASGPVVASIVALLNAARMEKGKAPLGFLNPWLYGAARSAFTDIISGGSRGCYPGFGGNGAQEVIGAGWNATRGWDPVTGLGTPDFQKLLKIALES